MAETEGERVRTDLCVAYEQIQKEDPKLLVAYKKYLLLPKTERGLFLADSTIARTIARRFADKEGAFSFKQVKSFEAMPGHSLPLLPTRPMVYLVLSVGQLRRIPRLAERIQGVNGKPLQDFKCGLFKSPVLILVIDALDECRSQGRYDLRSHILDLFSQAKTLQNISSRN